MTAAPLGELLAAAIAKGLTHLSLSSTPSADGKKLYWYCQAAPSTGHKYVSSKSLKAEDAVAEVLLALPKAPKRAAPSKKVTATVTAEPVDDANERDQNDPAVDWMLK